MYAACMRRAEAVRVDNSAAHEAHVKALAAETACLAGHRLVILQPVSCKASKWG